MELKPLLIARFGHAIFGVAIAAGSTNFWTAGAGELSYLLGGLGFTLGTIVAVRSFLMKVVLRDGVVEIRGWMWSRRIPRSAVVSVSEFPAVRWTDNTSGRARWSPVVWMMTGSRTLGFINRYNRAELKKLRKWVKPKRR